MTKRSLRVASWNVHWGRGDPDLIDRRGIELLALQEATEDSFRDFLSKFAWGFFAPDLAKEGGIAHERNHGPAILGTSRFAPRVRPLLQHLVAPEKLIVADLAMDEATGFLAFASYHALNGEAGPDHLDKPRLTLQVGEWLEHEPGPIVVGLDANSPAVDHPDDDKTRFWFEWLGPGSFERRLLGSDARHPLRDVLRTWYDTHPDELDALRAEHPDGPLAISHRSGRDSKEGNRPGTPRRYDHILATRRDFLVAAKPLYLYDEAWNVGSDHALVITDLEVRVAGSFHSDTGNMKRTRLLGGAAEDRLWAGHGGLTANRPPQTSEEGPPS